MSKNYYYTAQRPLRYFKFYNELLLTGEYLNSNRSDVKDSIT